MFDKYIDEFVPSVEMKEYLKGSHRSVDTIAEIIYYSPAPIERKRMALTGLIEELNPESDAELIFNSEAYLKTIDEAERLLKAEGVFSVEVCAYDEERGETDYEFDGLFNNFDDLVHYVKQNMKVCEVTDEDPWHYQAIKWINDESGKLVEACTYWIVRGEIWFVQLETEVLNKELPDIFMAHDLNVAVPFKAGDIVEVDFYPFADSRIIEIVEVGDNRDCCCLQALSRKRDGTWVTGAVKHSHIGDDILINMSPLYTITTYEGELSDEYEVLMSVSKYINGSEERGSALWNEIHASKSNDGLTDEELLSIIDKINEGV